MKTRLISAAVLLPVLLIILLALPEVVTAVMIGLMAAIGAYELLNNTGLVQHIRVNIYCMLFAFLVSIWSHLDMPHAWGVLGVVALICALFAEMMIDHVKLSFEKLSYCLFAALLVPFLLSSYLYSANVPDPELIIRPSGELRTSNFLLWQSAYSEYVFMNVLWPDFAPAHLDEAIAEYHRRNRRFGGV